MNERNGTNRGRAVQIITTGGTIASRVDPTTGGAVPAVDAAELVALAPSVRNHAEEVRVTGFGMLQSWNIGPDVMVRIASMAAEALRDDAVAGVVVTHGTDTMEETAFALDLLLDGVKPVVVTGAMRNASDPGFDGPRNLTAAVRVAVDAEARERGTLVVMNDEIHAARFVTKMHTSTPPRSGRLPRRRPVRSASSTTAASGSGGDPIPCRAFLPRVPRPTFTW